MEPLVKWSGGKTDEIYKFKEYIPDDINIYLEPFIGGGAVYFYLNPERAVINDKHTELTTFYRCMKANYGQYIYDFMEYFWTDDAEQNQLNYYIVRKLKDEDQLIINNIIYQEDLLIACKFYYLRKTCYRGMQRYNSKGGFNVPYGRYKKINYEKLLDEKYVELLNRTTILEDDFSCVFEQYNDETNFMFLDPPYHSKFTNYGFGEFGKEEHEQLAEYFKNTNIRCLMIIGKTDFIINLYKDYIVGEYEKKYKFKLQNGRVGDEINTNHLIIKNY